MSWFGNIILLGRRPGCAVPELDTHTVSLPMYILLHIDIIFREKINVQSFYLARGVARYLSINVAPTCKAGPST